jgi:small subunit ribosomal protein S17
MKKKLVGTVASAKRSKTLRVEIDRRFQHRKYGKIVRARTVCHVHDENNSASEGDLVEIVESRPMSKTKRWELVRVVQAAVVVDASHVDSDAAEGDAAEG